MNTVAGWGTQTLGDVCDPPQYGWTTKALPGSQGLKLLRTTDISAGTVDWDSVPACDREPPQVERYLLRDGDLVVSRAGSIGLSYLVTRPPRAVYASYLIRFRPRDTVLPTYLAWFLKSPTYWSQVRSRASGIALQNVNARQLKSISLPVPPLPVQLRIVHDIEEHVSRVERGLGSLEHAQKRLVDLRESVLEQAFGHDFEDRDLASLCSAFVDCEHRTPKYGTGEFPALRPRDVVGGEMDLADAGRVSRDEYQRQTRRHVPSATDVVYSRELSYGWAAEIPPDVTLCLGQGMVVFRVRDDVVPRWVVLYLNSRRGRSQAAAAATGSSHPHINVGDIRHYRIPAPSRPAQMALLQAVDRHISLVEELDRELAVARRRADRLKQAILGAAFAGRLGRRQVEPDFALARASDGPSIR